MLDPNHPEWRAFVASMRARPACDTTRLAFADWVAERGGEAFAVLIRAMVEAARIEPDNTISVHTWDKKTHVRSPNWEPFAAAERAIKSVWAAWSPVRDLYPEARNLWRFHRGFPDVVVIDWRGLKWLDTLCAIGPVGEVVVVGGSRVSWKLFRTTINFSLDDPHYHPRVASPVFVVDRNFGGVSVTWNDLVNAATGHFLEEIWGHKVTRIRYEPRNLKVWPDDGLNEYQHG